MCACKCYYINATRPLIGMTSMSAWYFGCTISIFNHHRQDSDDSKANAVLYNLIRSFNY